MVGGVPAVVAEPLLSGSFEAEPAGLANGFSSSVVFIVGGDVADRFVPPNCVVVDSEPGEFTHELDRVADVGEVGPLVLDGPQALRTPI